MKPKTAIQKKVAQLSATLRPLTARQEEWAYANCIEHFAYRTKSGILTCSDCGHQWKSGNGSLCDNLAGCRCPHCGAELKVYETLKRTDRQTQYFSVITTHKGFQLIRVARWNPSARKASRGRTTARRWCNVGFLPTERLPQWRCSVASHLCTTATAGLNGAQWRYAPITNYTIIYVNGERHTHTKGIYPNSSATDLRAISTAYHP